MLIHCCDINTRAVVLELTRHLCDIAVCLRVTWTYVSKVTCRHLGCMHSVSVWSWFIFWNGQCHLYDVALCDSKCWSWDLATESHGLVGASTHYWEVSTFCIKIKTNHISSLLNVVAVYCGKCLRHNKFQTTHIMDCLSDAIGLRSCQS